MWTNFCTLPSQSQSMISKYVKHLPPHTHYVKQIMYKMYFFWWFNSSSFSAITIYQAWECYKADNTNPDEKQETLIKIDQRFYRKWGRLDIPE